MTTRPAWATSSTAVRATAGTPVASKTTSGRRRQPTPAWRRPSPAPPRGGAVSAPSASPRPRRLATRSTSRTDAPGRRRGGDRLPDRPGAEDDSLLPRFDARTNDRAHRDRDGLDERSERRLEIAHREDLGGRHTQLLLQRPVAVDAHRLRLTHTFSPADPARVAVPAGRGPARPRRAVRHRAPPGSPARPPRRRPTNSCPWMRGKDLEAEIAEEVVEVRAAEPDRFGPDEHFAGPGLARLRHVEQLHDAPGARDDRSHASAPPTAERSCRRYADWSTSGRCFSSSAVPW